MGERFKTVGTAGTDGSFVRFGTLEGAAMVIQDWDKRYPHAAPHRAVHVVEMSPAELAEWEAWKARPVAGSESDTRGEATTGPVCDDCGCPSPDPDTLHEASGIRICLACEDRAAARAREYERAEQDNSPAPTVKEPLTVPPLLKVGDVVDGTKPEELARIPVGAVTTPEPESGTRWDTGNGFYEWIDGQMSWVNLAGRRVTKLTAEGESHWSYADARYGPRIPPTPPAPVEGAVVDASVFMRQNMCLEYDQIVANLTARDGAIRAEERRRCEAEIGRWMQESHAACAQLVSANDRIAELERYVGGQMLRSDFRTADEMRAALDAANARLAQGGSGEQGASSLNITLISSWLRQMADDIDDVATETKVQTVAFALKHLQARVRDLEKEICDMLRAEKEAVQEVEAHAAAQEGRP